MTRLKPLIETLGLSKHFAVRQGLLGRATGAVRAVDEVNLRIHRGEVVGLVGESGSGKSTLGRVMMMAEPPSSGSVIYDGYDIAASTPRQLHPFRRKMQMVFQDPYSSLNPRMTVEDSLTMPLRFHQPEMSARARRDKAAEVLESVGLSRSTITRYPHEFSGGQRQRIGIARALMVDPEFIMADEPVSALDVSVQAQVLNLFSEIRTRLGLTLLFVTHDLAVVGHIADRVAVMYLGQIMEIAPTRALFAAPAHPYTETLLSAAPDPVLGRNRKRIVMKGEPPSPMNPPSGCVFRTRCPYAVTACAQARPLLVERAPGHATACIRDDITLTPAVRDTPKLQAHA
ncbi:peptide ABC transporter ATP-binding protein [Rhodobacter sp. TJ_12]|uniref:ABC transporter ATP-binding protein n=1 Tax=Rhodobacter sp. TJ_12 TaxID=2029399 RepID=UPI001CBC3447|nr:oligopeptide/dipeptide ABC transporter ATP-binding protein [Rhodobacter sp. TJ_12]MBZ4021556.1 peptide ABC transporter ATP-binding protein [Rhodobacter sp. TJ_12]